MYQISSPALSDTPFIKTPDYRQRKAAIADKLNIIRELNNDYFIKKKKKIKCRE